MKQSSSYRRYSHALSSSNGTTTTTTTAVIEDITNVPIHQEEKKIDSGGMTMLMMEMEEGFDVIDDDDFLANSSLSSSCKTVNVVDARRQPVRRAIAQIQLFLQILFVFVLIEGFHRFVAREHLGGRLDGGAITSELGIEGNTTNSNQIIDYYDSFQFVNSSSRTLHKNDSCVLVSCHTYNAPGLSYFMDYYDNHSQYSVHVTEFQNLFYKKDASNAQATAVLATEPNSWCRIQAVLEAMRSFPRSRIVYTNLDVRIDPQIWCTMPYLGTAAAATTTTTTTSSNNTLTNDDAVAHTPIIMNTIWKETSEKISDDAYAEGFQLQTNVFVVAPAEEEGGEGGTITPNSLGATGAGGLSAMKRWERLYQPLNEILHDDETIAKSITTMDQTALHIQEKGRSCGIPGWIACYNNPIQNECSCGDIENSKEEDDPKEDQTDYGETMEKCMHNLFVEMKTCSRRKHHTRSESSLRNGDNSNDTATTTPTFQEYS